MAEEIPPPNLPEYTEPGATEAPGKCASCGSSNLGSGVILTNSPHFRPAPFAPKKITPRRARRMLRVWQNTLETTAMVCRDCGYVMLYVDPERLKSLEKKYPAS